MGDIVDVDYVAETGLHCTAHDNFPALVGSKVLRYDYGVNVPGYGLLYQQGGGFPTSPCTSNYLRLPQYGFLPVLLYDDQVPDDGALTLTRDAQPVPSGQADAGLYYLRINGCTAYYHTGAPNLVVAIELQKHYNTPGGFGLWTTFFNEDGDSTDFDCTPFPPPPSPPPPSPSPPPPSPSPPPPSPSPPPAPPPPSPPELYTGGGCRFYSDDGYDSNNDVRTRYARDQGLSVAGTITQPIIGAGTSVGTGFTMDIFTDNAAWNTYKDTLNPLGDQLPGGLGVLYYQLSTDWRGAGHESAVVSNARCVEMCNLWDACATYEYFMYDHASNSARCGDTSPLDGNGNRCGHVDSYMRCELWVYPLGNVNNGEPKDEHVTAANDRTNVWCGAGASAPHYDASNIPNNVPDLEDENVKGNQPWPPGGSTRMLSSSMVVSGSVESFNTIAFATSLAAELNVSASDITVTAEAASVRIVILINTLASKAQSLAGSFNVLLQDSNRVAVNLGVSIESYEAPAITFHSPPSPPPPPPPSPRPRFPPITPPPSPPPSPPSPPATPPVAQPCAADGSDDVCSPFAGATWSSAAAQYHFYLYDETDDGVDLRLWEWPRLTPQDAQLANNGICEDGLPAVNTSIPQGDYYVAFGSPDCAVHHVNLSTALISGCGRIDLVPCVLGTDCKDCGRSASATAAATTRRRRAEALPALDNEHELRHLSTVLKTATSYHLPGPWLQAMQITHHWNAGETRGPT